MTEVIKNGLRKIKNEQIRIRKEVKERTIGYIVAALGLVAGLAWNDAIKSLIEYLSPLKSNTVLAKFVYAIMVTALIVFVTIYLIQIIGPKEEKK